MGRRCPGLHWPGSVSPSTGVLFSSACDPPQHPSPSGPQSIPFSLWSTRPMSYFSVYRWRGGGASLRVMERPPGGLWLLPAPHQGDRGGHMRPFPHLGLHLAPADSLESGSQGSKWRSLIMILITPQTCQRVQILLTKARFGAGSVVAVLHVRRWGCGHRPEAGVAGTAERTHAEGLQDLLPRFTEAGTEAPATLCLWLNHN